jgi:hypothetical protein
MAAPHPPSWIERKRGGVLGKAEPKERQRSARGEPKESQKQLRAKRSTWPHVSFRHVLRRAKLCWQCTVALRHSRVLLSCLMIPRRVESSSLRAVSACSVSPASDRSLARPAKLSSHRAEGRTVPISPDRAVPTKRPHISQNLHPPPPRPHAPWPPHIYHALPPTPCQLAS